MTQNFTIITIILLFNYNCNSKKKNIQYIIVCNKNEMTQNFTTITIITITLPFNKLQLEKETFNTYYLLSTIMWQFLRKFGNNHNDRISTIARKKRHNLKFDESHSIHGSYRSNHSKFVPLFHQHLPPTFLPPFESFAFDPYNFFRTDDDHHLFLPNSNFRTSARKHTPRSPRGAIYEFTPQMRIMALIRDIWLEHCRGSPHACPRRFPTLCAAVLVSHRWLQPQPLHIYIYITHNSNFRPLFSDSPIVNRFSAATFRITRTRTPCSSFNLHNWYNT